MARLPVFPVELKSADDTFYAPASGLEHRKIAGLTLAIGFYNRVVRFPENTEVPLEDERP